MSTVDSLNEAILALKTENIQYGGGQPGTNEAKAAFHLNQALELLAAEEPGADTPAIPPTREENGDDPAESEERPVPTEIGQEGEVSQEASEETEAEESGAAVADDAMSKFAAPPGRVVETSASAPPSDFDTADPSD